MRKSARFKVCSQEASPNSWRCLRWGYFVVALSLGPISMFRLGLLDLVLMYLYFPLDYVKGSLPSPMFVVVAGALLLVAPVGFIAWTWFARKSDQIPLHTLLMYASLCIFYPFKLYSQINAPAQSSAGNFAIMPQEYPVSFVSIHIDGPILLFLGIWLVWRGRGLGIKGSFTFHWLLFVALIWACCFQLVGPLGMSLHLPRISQIDNNFTYFGRRF